MIAVDLIISSDIVLTMDANNQVIDKGAIAVKGDAIVDVGESARIYSMYDSYHKLDLGPQIVLPGFINGHVHSPMTLLRSCSDNSSLVGWLNDTIFPLEKLLMGPEFVYWGTSLALLEMIQGGITTIVDMYWNVDNIARACRDHGMRAIIGSTILHHRHELEHAKEFIESWKNVDGITPAFAPHSLAEVPFDLLHETCSEADKFAAPLLLHVSETQEGTTKILNQYCMRPIELLKHENMLLPQSIFAHAIHITRQELQEIVAIGAGIIHCPTSNMKLASGIAPFATMLEHNCLVGLGTDGAASNNSLDMISEMKLALLLQRVYTKKPDSVSAWDVLECATSRGAKAIHKNHEIGSIEIGKKADIISVRLNSVHQIPVYDPISTLVFSSHFSDVQTVIIGGIIKLQDGVLQFPRDHLEEIRAHVSELANKVRAAIKDNSLK